MTTSSLPERRIRFQIVSTANVDPRTLAKYYAGAKIHPALADSIRRALAKLGLPDPRAATKGGAK